MLNRYMEAFLLLTTAQVMELCVIMPVVRVHDEGYAMKEGAKVEIGGNER